MLPVRVINVRRVGGAYTSGSIRQERRKRTAIFHGLLQEANGNVCAATVCNAQRMERGKRMTSFQSLPFVIHLIDLTRPPESVVPVVPLFDTFFLFVLFCRLQKPTGPLNYWRSTMLDSHQLMTSSSAWLSNVSSTSSNHGSFRLFLVIINFVFFHPLFSLWLHLPPGEGKRTPKKTLERLPFTLKPY